jgi:tetratricopeptide (TPR) repeat protein
LNSLALMAGLSSSVAYAACSLGQIAQLPVTMRGLTPLVPVKINGVDTYLIADSGAFWSSLSPGKAAEFKLRLEPAPEGMMMYGVGGSAIAFSVTRVKDFGVAGTTLHNLEFVVGGNELGFDSAGLLGENFWSVADVEYDLANGVIRLLRSKGCDKRQLAYWASGKAHSELSIESLRGRFAVVGAAEVNGSRIRVLFDTGAATSMLSLSAAARAGIRPDSPGVKPGGLQYGLGRRYVETWIAPVSSFKLGDDEEIHDTHLRIGGNSADLDVDMLLGADFFLSHRVYVSAEQRRIDFTYNGGPVFNLSTASMRVAARPVPAAAADALPGSPPDAGAVVDDSLKGSSNNAVAAGNDAQATGRNSTSATAALEAANFSRLGMSLVARRDFANALADLDRACALAPEEPSYLIQRGRVHAELQRSDLALKDLDAALALQPNSLEALLARAVLRLRGREEQAARADLDAAAAAAPQPSDVRFEIADLYERAGSHAEAINQFDLWIEAHPVDRKLDLAYNERCWIRVLQGQELHKALDDCNEAVHLTKSTPALNSVALNSRGWVRLRLGDYRKSIEDYDGALRLNPKIAWSLYGRGVAELRLGLGAQGKADITAATAVDANIGTVVAKYGLSVDTAILP